MSETHSSQVKPPSFPVNQEFPKEFPSWWEADGKIKTFSPRRIGGGSRMEIYKSTDGKHVLRVPIYTERRLIERTGGSGILASDGDPTSEISLDTIRDISHYETAKNYVGRNTVGVLPMYFPDQLGNWRTYSLQRFVQKTMDFGDLWYMQDKLSETEKKRIRRMIEDIRELVTETGLILDLCGPGNVALDDKGFPRIIDVNMIQSLVPNEELLLPEFRDPSLEHDVIMAARTQTDRVLPTMLNRAFYSLNGYPIGDWSLDRLKRLEVNFGMKDPKEIDRDEVYSKYTCSLRDEIMNGINNSMHFSV
jgi:hypothetical protein